MPWSNPNNFLFDKDNILQYAPRASGVYRIHNADREIYIASSPNMQESLLGHLRGDVACILQATPVWFSCQLADNKSALKKAQELVAELKPLCN